MYCNNSGIEINGPDEELTATETTSEYECGYGVSALGASDGSIDLDISGGSTCEPYTFNWIGPSGFTSENQNLSGLSAGIYSVIISDVNGCLYSIPSIEITEPAELTITETHSSYECEYGVTCFGATDGSIDITVEGGCK